SAARRAHLPRHPAGGLSPGRRVHDQRARVVSGTRWRRRGPGIRGRCEGTMVRRILIALALVLAPASAGAAPDVDSNEKENAAPDVATDEKDGAAPDLDTDDKDGAAPDLDTDDVEGGAAVEVDTEAATHADAADDADAAVVARTEDPEEELVVRHVAASGAPA